MPIVFLTKYESDRFEFKTFKHLKYKKNIIKIKFIFVTIKMASSVLEIILYIFSF